MSKWHRRFCDDCGAEMFIHEDWNNPPSICKACKEQCIAQSMAHKKRKKSRVRKEDDVIDCKGCGCSFKKDPSQEHSPEYCAACKKAFPPKKNGLCDSCGKNFSILPETIVQYNKNRWNLPKRCAKCRKWSRRGRELEDSKRGSGKTKKVKGSQSFFSAIEETGFEPKGLPISGGIPSLGKKR